VVNCEVLGHVNAINALSKFTGSRDLGQVGATRVTNSSICEATSLLLTVGMLRDTNVRSFEAYCEVSKPLSANANSHLSKIYAHRRSEALPYSLSHRILHCVRKQRSQIARNRSKTDTIHTLENITLYLISKIINKKIHSFALPIGKRS